MLDEGAANAKRDLEIYSILRAYARDEGEYINQRLNWLGVSQSVLLTGYAALISLIGSGDVGALVRRITVSAFGFVIGGGWVLTTVFGALALTGTMLCVLTFINVAGAFESEDSIKAKWGDYLGSTADPSIRQHLPFMAFGFNPKGGHANPIWRVGMVLVPAFFAALWAVLGGFAVLLVHSSAPA